MQPIAVPSGNEVKYGAYLDHIRSGAALRQEGRVLAVLALAGEPLTRHEIAERGGMALSAACGRVSSLKDLGMIEQAGSKKEPGMRSARSTLQLTEKGKVEIEQFIEDAQVVIQGELQ